MAQDTDSSAPAGADYFAPSARLRSARPPVWPAPRRTHPVLATLSLLRLPAWPWTLGSNVAQIISAVLDWP